jgi:hypothetical protein
MFPMRASPHESSVGRSSASTRRGRFRAAGPAEAHHRVNWTSRTCAAVAPGQGDPEPLLGPGGGHRASVGPGEKVTGTLL